MIRRNVAIQSMGDRCRLRRRPRRRGSRGAGTGALRKRVTELGLNSRYSGDRELHETGAADGLPVNRGADAVLPLASARHPRNLRPRPNDEARRSWSPAATAAHSRPGFRSRAGQKARRRDASGLGCLDIRRGMAGHTLHRSEARETLTCRPRNGYSKRCTSLMSDQVPAGAHQWKPKGKRDNL
jgi:hypothetical protein